MIDIMFPGSDPGKPAFSGQFQHILVADLAAKVIFGDLFGSKKFGDVRVGGLR